MANKNRLYPHLLPDDIELWQRFLAANPKRFEYYDYDVRVGTGRDPGPTNPPHVRQQAIQLSQRRIDAIGHARGTLTVIEITTSAGLKAIGQLIAYPQLLRDTFQITRPIQTLLVASELQPDIEKPLLAAGIPWEIYPKPPD